MTYKGKENMKTGRPTTDLKDTVIRIRLNADMRTHVEKNSQKYGITISEYLRNLITKDMR